MRKSTKSKRCITIPHLLVKSAGMCYIKKNHLADYTTIYILAFSTGSHLTDQDPGILSGTSTLEFEGVLLKSLDFSFLILKTILELCSFSSYEDIHNRYIVYCCWYLVAKSHPTLCDPGTAAHQTPLSMRFPRQECWNKLTFPSPGDLPAPRIEPTSLALASQLFTTEPLEKPHIDCYISYYVYNHIG